MERFGDEISKVLMLMFMTFVVQIFLVIARYSSQYIRLFGDNPGYRRGWQRGSIEPFSHQTRCRPGRYYAPLYFVIALQVTLTRHDNVSSKGVQFGEDTIHTLTYVDDAALLDNETATETARVTAIA